MVITDVNQVVYQGNGSNTAFPFTFRIIDATDVKLLLIDADGTETDITSDYFVDTVNSTVHYPGYAPGAEPPEADRPAPVQTGQRLVVYRELPITQEKDLGDKWPFFVIELGLDKLTMILQQIYGWWGRTLKFPIGWQEDHPDFDTSIPIEAGKTWRVNDDGTGFVASDASEEAEAIANEAKDTADAAALAATGAVNTANAAKETADGIAGTAQDALDTAQDAKETADGIAGTAQDAFDTAENANQTSSDALSLANENKTNLESKATWFETVADMRASTKLKAGYVAATKNYYANSGGGAFYSVRTKTVSDIDDGGSIIFLLGNLVAVLIPDDVINVKQFGAKGDGIADDSTAINNALKYGIGSTVYFPAGTFLCTTHIITAYSCTEVRGEKGKTILRRGYNLSLENTAVLFRIYATDNETTIHDITIKNIVFDGNGRTFNERSFDITYFGDYPTENLVVDGCDFLDCIDYHAIDLNQCSRAIIRNCRFLGWELKYESGSVATQREAIQFDGYSNDADATRNNHIIIENCYFGASDNFGAYPCAVGNHGFSDTGDTVFFNKVIIRNCTFKELTFFAVHLYIYNDVVIENNHCDGCQFVNIGNKDVPNAVYANKNVYINGNTVYGATPYLGNAIYSSAYRTSTDTSTYAAASTTNLIISNNYFKNYGKSIQLEPNGADGVIISSNIFEHCGDDTAYGNTIWGRVTIKSFKIINNIFRNSGALWLSKSDLFVTSPLDIMSDVAIIGNSFIDVYKETRAIYIPFAIKGLYIAHNVIDDSITTRTASYEYVVVNGAVGGAIKNNTIYTKTAMTRFYNITNSDVEIYNNRNYINNALVSTVGTDYLPLSGGTLTGGLKLSGTAPWISTDSSSKYLRLLNVDYNSGASLYLYGKDADTNPGGFSLNAYDGTNRKELKCLPDGTITWGGNNIALAKDYLALSGGTITGRLLIGNESPGRGVLGVNGNMFRIASENWSYNDSGAFLQLYGKSAGGTAGKFQLAARTDEAQKVLEGNPNGTLTWDGNDISPQQLTTINPDDTDVPNNTNTTLATFTLTKGTWIVHTTVDFPINATGYRRIGIATNSTSIGMGRHWYISQQAINGTNTKMSLTTFVTVSGASATYCLNAHQTSGSTLSVGSGIQAFRVSSIT